MKTAEALATFGTKVALAKALGITHAAICHWGEEPPLVRQFQIEVLTDGALRANRNNKTTPAADENK